MRDRRRTRPLSLTSASRVDGEATSTTITGSGTKRALSSIVGSQVTATSGMRHSSPSCPTATPGPASYTRQGRVAPPIARLNAWPALYRICACRILVGAMSRTRIPATSS
jgi:hypothetical protein